MASVSQLDEPYLSTYTGRKLHLLNPQPEDFDIWDIAVGLSREGRYSNQMKTQYRVGQHCVIVAKLREKMGFFTNKQVVLQALLHDASEAYLRDIPSPVKRLLPDYKVLEKRIQGAIFRKWGLPEELPASIKDCDSAALVAESRDMNFKIDYYPTQLITDLAGWIDKIEPQDEDNVFFSFLHMFGELTESGVG